MRLREGKKMASVFAALVFIFGIEIVVGGGDIHKKVYELMCDDNDQAFREEMMVCLKDMSKKDQVIFQICGSALSEEFIEDFDSIVDEMCGNISSANLISTCVDHLHYMIYHLKDDDPDHHHHHPHEHHDHPHKKDDDDHKHEDDHHNHDHPGHDHHYDHHHHHAPKHGIYAQECFTNLYSAYNLTRSTPPEESED